MKFVKLLAAAALPLSFLAAPALAQQANGVVISQFAVRGPQGGNDEFVEIYNGSASTVAIGGWTLQGCANASPGTASIRATVPAGTNLLPGRYYLFANTVTPTNTSYSLGVAPDATYSTGFTDFTNAGFSGIRLVSGTSLTGPAIDAVGGNASPCHEGTGIVTTTVNGATSYLRRLVSGVVQDANNNATDFPASGTANPRNSASPANGGGGGNLPTVSIAVAPASFAENGGSATLTATLSAAYTAPVTVNLTFSGTATNGTDYTPSASSITIATGATSGSITLSAIDDLAFEGDETVIATLGTLTNATAGTPNTATATIIDNDPQPPPVIGPHIYQIQGAGHISPMVGQNVSNVPGIVTAIASNGFYMQDADGDGNVNTSDGINVFTVSAPTVTVGQQVLVSGTVSEFRPNAATGLSITEIDSPTVTPSANLFTNTTITPTVLGAGGRVPPTDIIDNDSNGNVETSPTRIFDPAEDGIDFYETVEGMLVQINNPVLTSPTLAGAAAADRQFFVLGDNGAGATGRTARGGVALVERATGVDYNPERIELFTGLPNTNAPNGTIFNVGDRLAGPIRGVMSYFGNFEVLPLAAPVVATPNPVLTPTVTSIARGGDRLTVAAFNIENYDPLDPVARRNQVAAQIVTNLGSPDIISLGEVQDNNGATNNGIVDADVTLQTLIDAIVAAGGPRYSYQQINPVNNADGGEPGGNIRVVQIYNAARVTFVPGTVGVGNSTTATTVSLVDGRLALSLSPGRLSPTNTAWNSSRKPLAVTYDFNGRRVMVIGNHFNSKGGDQSLFGVNQPPVLSSETQRRLQTQIVHDFVYNALQLDPTANIVVLGDLNDFDFSNPLRILRNGALGPNGVEGTQPALINLGTALVADPAERYSYVFDGNSQELDHILATPFLFRGTSPQYQVAHTNSEYGNQASDHDPLVSSYLLPVADILPDSEPSRFTAVRNAELSTVYTSNTITVTGINAPAPFTVSGGSYSLNGGAFTTAPGFLLSGDTLMLRVTSSSSFDTRVLATLTIPRAFPDGDDFNSSYVVTTRKADVTPDAFTFNAVTNAEPLTSYTSNPVTVAGVEAPVTVQVSGGEFSVNGQPFTTVVTTVSNGDTVRVRTTSSFNYSTRVQARLTIGTVSNSFSVTTRAADRTPDTFVLGSVSNATPATLYLSNTVTISGVEVPVAISVASGEYSINGGAFTSAAGTVANGDQVQVRTQSSATAGARVLARLTVGTVTGSFTVTTRTTP